MNAVDLAVAQYKARRDAAYRQAIAEGVLRGDETALAASTLGDAFEVGRNRGGKARSGRGTVRWTDRMTQGPVGRKHRRGHVGQRILTRKAEFEARVAAGDACPIDEAGSMPTGMGCEDEAPCGVNVIGGNTLGTTGVAPAATVPLVITAGDAGYFQPRAIYWEAFPFATNDLIDPAALPAACCVLPSILVDAAIGRVSMLRRGGSPDRGLTQGGFANTKELVAVDWGEFVSTNEQNLTLFYYNPNQNITVHVFVDLWGNI